MDPYPKDPDPPVKMWEIWNPGFRKGGKGGLIVNTASVAGIGTGKW